MAYNIQTDPQYKLRLPVELKEKVVKSAKLHNRSMNADMVARLSDSFSRPPALLLEVPLDQFSTEEILSELMRRAEDAEMVLKFERLKTEE